MPSDLSKPEPLGHIPIAIGIAIDNRQPKGFFPNADSQLDVIRTSDSKTHNLVNLLLDDRRKIHTRNTEQYRHLGGS